MRLTCAVCFLALWSADSTCSCRDGSCNEVCGGLCNAEQNSMTHQEMCCACPQWECAQSWSNGNASTCEGHAGGSCDLSSCNQCYSKAVALQGDTMCKSYLGSKLHDASVEECAQKCTTLAGCVSFEYWRDEPGNDIWCRMCDDGSHPSWGGNAKRRIKFHKSSWDCSECGCAGGFCFCECDWKGIHRQRTCQPWSSAPKKVLIAIPWLVAAAAMA
ncbi:unnamed protein product [Symbiodinium natans]|uniref:Apple domain-containing protein n=1 Tax=Symbiodinium natans TaxID=878477 RepID=A0A812Q1W3_9DINO|nr:unnamed protein product [Symbiodinium natans]